MNIPKYFAVSRGNFSNSARKGRLPIIDFLHLRYSDFLAIFPGGRCVHRNAHAFRCTTRVRVHTCVRACIRARVTRRKRQRGSFLSPSISRSRSLARMYERTVRRGARGRESVPIAMVTAESRSLARSCTSAARRTIPIAFGRLRARSRNSAAARPTGRGSRAYIAGPVQFRT